jgi:hypothetical protein
MSRLEIDHIILIVKDLNTASKQFSQLGFTVVPGGVHSSGATHNALVPFQDGTYLELLSTTRSSQLSLLILLKKLRLLNLYLGEDSAINKRLMYDLAGGLGMADFCMGAYDLDEEITRLRSHNIKYTDPIPGGRKRPDDQEISWRTSVPRNRDLPFLIDDQTPRELRVPVFSSDNHQNGILGIRGLVILVKDLVNNMANYRVLLDDDPISKAQYPQPGTQSSEFNFEGRFISIVSPLPGRQNQINRKKYRISSPVGIFFYTAADETRDLLCLTYFPDQGLTLSRSKTLFT